MCHPDHADVRFRGVAGRTAGAIIRQLNQKGSGLNARRDKGATVIAVPLCVLVAICQPRFRLTRITPRAPIPPSKSRAEAGRGTGAG